MEPNLIHIEELTIYDLETMRPIATTPQLVSQEPGSVTFLIPHPERAGRSALVRVRYSKLAVQDATSG